jgi:hypothetical protein
VKAYSTIRGMVIRNYPPADVLNKHFYPCMNHSNKM